MLIERIEKMKLGGLGAKLFSRFPSFIRNPAIETFNSLRLKRLNVNSHSMPLWLTIFVTNRCNLKCQHCFYWKELNTETAELTVEEYENIFKSMRTHFRTIRLSGGEPFLRKDLLQFYLMIDGLGLANKLSIPTNGTVMSCIDTVYGMLSASRRNVELNVSVSLDGLRETHDSMRGAKGVFDRAIDTLRKLLEIEKEDKLLTVSVCITVGKHNVGELVELVRFIKDDIKVTNYGFDYARSVNSDIFNIDPTICSEFSFPSEAENAVAGRGKGSMLDLNTPALNIEKTREVNTLLYGLMGNSMGGKLNNLRLETALRVKESQSRVIRCLAGYIDCVIYPSGEVAVCEFTKPFANIREFNYNFPSLWHSEKANWMRIKTQSCACTHPCHLADSITYDSRSLIRLFEDSR